MNASTNQIQITNIIRLLKENSPQARKARDELTKLLKRGKARKLHLAGHVGHPHGVSGVMVNRLALGIMQLQDPKYGETYVKCVGLAKDATTRGIDAYVYTDDGVAKVRAEIPRALKKGLIKTRAHKVQPHRKTLQKAA